LLAAFFFSFLAVFWLFLYIFSVIFYLGWVLSVFRDFFFFPSCVFFFFLEEKIKKKTIKKSRTGLATGAKNKKKNNDKNLETDHKKNDAALPRPELTPYRGPLQHFFRPFFYKKKNRKNIYTARRI